MNPENIRVLEIQCEPFSSGGQEAFIMNVIERINKVRYTIDVFTPYYCDNDYYSQIINACGGELLAYGIEFREGGLKFNIIKPIREALRAKEYDVVHIHSGSVFSLAMAAYAAKLERVRRIIVHSHATADKHTFKRDIIKFFCTPILSACATDYLACSLEAGKWKFSPSICKSKLNVVKNGIDIERFSFDRDMRNQIRKTLGFSDKTIVLGHVGRFSYEKNQLFILELQKKLLSNGINSKVLLIGSGSLVEKTKCYAKTLDVDDSVIFLGRANNVNDYMQAMDVFLLPSLFEGLGIVAIEAQTSGLYVITSDKVPQDVCFTDHIRQISLSDNNKWVEAIREYINLDIGNLRRDESKHLTDSVYDIKKSVREIEAIYG